MVDVVDRATRSRMMSGIRATDTKPELILRRGLHKAGFRFRLHDKDLPGKPDMVFSRYRAVLFAHGCFWHGHDCALFRWPATRETFWRMKIEKNRLVDARNETDLETIGWRYGIVWECALRGKYRMTSDDVFAQISRWLKSGQVHLELSGRVTISGHPE